MAGQTNPECAGMNIREIIKELHDLEKKIFERVRLAERKMGFHDFLWGMAMMALEDIRATIIWWSQYFIDKSRDPGADPKDQVLWGPVWDAVGQESAVYQIMFASKRFKNWLDFEDLWKQWLFDKLTAAKDIAAPAYISPLHLE
jgi:hypothetical protein